MNQIPPQLKSISSAYRALKDNCELRDHELKFKTLFNEDTFEILQDLKRNGLLAELFIDGSAGYIENLSLSSNIGCEIEAEVTYPKKLATGFFVKDLSQLLNIGKNKFKNPCHYYIADLDYLSDELASQDQIINFRDTLTFIELLQKTCDHVQEHANNNILIFLNKNKIEIPINYTCSNLTELNEIDTFAKLSLSEEQREQRKVILRNVITDLLKDIPMPERFTYLLKQFELVKQRCHDNFDLYVSDFSFEKLTEELEERKIEYLSRLDGVISDIQNKILAIPLALVLIGGQIKAAESISVQNCIVLLGAIIFVVLMSILILNQEQTLINIRRDIATFSDRFIIKYPTIHTKFEDIFSSLDDRCIRQQRILMAIMLIVLLVGFLAIGLFDYYTPKYNITFLGGHIQK